MIMIMINLYRFNETAKFILKHRVRNIYQAMCVQHIYIYIVCTTYIYEVKVCMCKQSLVLQGSHCTLH